MRLVTGEGGIGAEAEIESEIDAVRDTRAAAAAESVVVIGSHAVAAAAAHTVRTAADARNIDMETTTESDTADTRNTSDTRMTNTAVHGSSRLAVDDRALHPSLPLLPVAVY